MAAVCYIHTVTGRIISLYDFFSSGKHIRIPLKLHQTYGSADIRHIALIPGALYIILPGSDFGLCQGILGLAMQAVELILMIYFFIIYTGYIPPRCCTALCGSKILNRMERKRCKVRNASYLSALIYRAYSMCSILNDKHPAYCLLYPSSQIGIPGRLKTGFLPLHYIHYPVIVTRDSSQVYGYYSLCLFIYHAFQGIIVKLRRIRL